MRLALEKATVVPRISRAANAVLLSPGQLSSGALAEHPPLLPWTAAAWRTGHVACDECADGCGGSAGGGRCVMMTTVVMMMVMVMVMTMAVMMVMVLALGIDD